MEVLATARKQYPLRIDPEVWAAVERWAADEMRSANAQVEWILRDALKRAGRAPATERIKLRRRKQSMGTVPTVRHFGDWYQNDGT